MYPRTAFVAIIATLVHSVLIAQVKSPSSNKSVRIFGRMLGPTGPMRNETILLKTNGHAEDMETHTNYDGDFNFVVQPESQYDLSVPIPGFTGWSTGIQVQRSDVNLGNVVAQLLRPIAISGQIIDCADNSLRAQTVSLLIEGREETHTAQTDSNGAFRFSGLQPSLPYALRIAATGLRPTQMDVDAGEMNVDMGAIVVQPIRPLRAETSVGKSATAVPDRTARVSGRVTDASGIPVAGILDFRKVNQELSSLEIDPNGAFVLPVEGRTQYEVYVRKQNVPPVFDQIARLEIADGQDIDLGIVAVRFAPQNKSMATLAGSVKISEVSATTEPRRTSAKNPVPKVAAIFAANGGSVHVIQSNGTIEELPAETGQVGCSSLLISEDLEAAGWLVDSDFCCTSYPIQQRLVVYRPGKPLQRFTGDGRAIFDWRFVGGGKQVAFYQSFLHGTSAQHYELHDSKTGRLIDKWDGDLTMKAPKWTKGLKS